MLLSACNHLFYYPDSHLYMDPEKLSVPVETLSLKTDDGETISAWLVNDKPDSKGLILHFHGNAQNLSAHLGFSLWLAEAGYSVLIFDYRGYGQSSGQPTQRGILLDAKAVMNWIDASQRFQKKKRIVFAQSLGGAVASSALAENPDFASSIDYFIIESSFPSYRRVARSVLGQHPITWAFQYPFSFLVSDDTKPYEAIAKLGMPKLFVHGDADNVVPYAMGELYFQYAGEPKEFWRVPYGLHTQAFILGSPFRGKLLQKLEALK